MRSGGHGREITKNKGGARPGSAFGKQLLEVYALACFSAKLPMKGSLNIWPW